MCSAECDGRMGVCMYAMSVENRFCCAPVEILQSPHVLLDEELLDSILGPCKNDVKINPKELPSTAFRNRNRVLKDNAMLGVGCS
jgi:hypothetical protein